jgi:hypothetical protein
MTGEPDLVTLLYRADWTRLSLTAEVRGMLDDQLLARYDEARHQFARSVPPGLTGVRHFRARLLVTPNVNWRARCGPRPKKRGQLGPLLVPGHGGGTG